MRPTAPELARGVESMAPLGAQAMALRYPSLEEEPPPDEARAALINARRLITEVSAWIIGNPADR